MTDSNDNTALQAEPLLMTGEVADLWQVDPKTIARWADSGWGGSFRTPAGHRRFRESAVRLPVNGSQS